MFDRLGVGVIKDFWGTISSKEHVNHQWGVPPDTGKLGVSH